jgi:hypothetical protein
MSSVERAPTNTAHAVCGGTLILLQRPATVQEYEVVADWCASKRIVQTDVPHTLTVAKNP